MKIKSLTLFLAAALAVAGAGCGAANQKPGGGAANADPHAGMNHGPGAMNGGAMDHAAMKSAPEAAAAPYDLQFIDTMTAHHESAVAMARPAVEKAAHAELKTLARAIVADQEKEIAQMRRWRDEWFAGRPPALNMELPGMAGSMMDMKKLDAAAGGAYDLAFVEMMIRHHEGAVLMAEDALRRTGREEIKKLANAVIEAQRAEIAKMKEWQAAWSK